MKKPMMPLLMTTIQKERMIESTQRQLDECLAMLALFTFKNGNEYVFDMKELTEMPNLSLSVSQEDSKITLKLTEVNDEELQKVD